MTHTLDRVHRGIAEGPETSRHTSSQHLAPAMRCSASSRSYSSSSDRPAVVRRPSLSSREIEVLLEWLRSDSKSAVATRLYVTESTVSTHLTRIRRKYDDVGRPASTKAALVARAVQDGLISLDEL